MAILKKSVPLKLGPLMVVHVDLSSVVEGRKSLTTICDNDHEPTAVTRPTLCPTCEATTGFKKGMKIGGELHVVDQEAVDEAKEGDAKTKDQIVLTVHPSQDVIKHTVPNGPSYYIAPSKGSEESYVALKSVVQAAPDTAFCAVFSIRSRPAMYMLRMYNDCLRLEQLAWPDELNPAPPAPDAATDDATLQLATTIVNGLRTEFDVTNYQDAQALALHQTLANGSVVATGSGDSTALETLQAAVAALSAKDEATVAG